MMGSMERKEASGKEEEANGRRIKLPSEYTRETNPKVDSFVSSVVTKVTRQEVVLMVQPTRTRRIPLRPHVST